MRTLVPEFREVYTTFSLADLREASQATPCAHVIYVGDNPGASVGRGERTVVDQRWMIVIAVRHAGAQLQKTSGVRELAGELIPKMLAAVNDWKPVNYMLPLRRVSGASSVGHSPTFSYFPFLFEGRLIT